VQASDTRFVYIIAGPNGAGKTTFAREFLTEFGLCEHFINADEIAQRICPEDPGSVSRRAGRLMLQEIDRLAQSKQTFAFETTLAGRSLMPLVQRWRNQGYHIHLFFLWLPSAEMALERVANRVRMGGHFVPEEDVRRRYLRGLQNLVTVYRSLVNSALVFDNSSPPPRAVVGLEPDGRLNIYNQELFQQMLNMR